MKRLYDRKLPFAAIVFLVCIVALFLTPRRNSSTLTLVVDADKTSDNFLGGINVGGLGSLLSVGGHGTTELYRVDQMARSEWAFLSLLQDTPEYGEEAGLGDACSYADTVGAYQNFRRSQVSTRLSSDSQSLQLQFVASDRDLARRCVIELGNLVVDRLNDMRRDQSRLKGDFLADQTMQAERNLAAVEDSLVTLLDRNRIGLSSPRIQQQIENVRRRIEIWSATLQTLRAEKIRMSASVASNIPDIYSALPATRFDHRTGMGPLKIIFFSLLAGAGVILLLTVLERSR